MAGGGWWCCCNRDCVHFYDDFERADSDDIGADWAECGSDDWEILDGTLTSPVADDWVACLHMEGWPVGIMKATVSIDDPAHSFDSVGGTAQIFAYVGTVDTPCSGDTAGIWRLELEVVDSSEGVLSLYDPNNDLVGTRQVLFTGTTCEMALCVAWDDVLEDSTITATCTGLAGIPIWTCHGVMPTYWFALGNKYAVSAGAGTNQVYYESAEYIDHFDHNPLCPNCQWYCCCHCLEAEDRQPTLTATVVGNGEADCYVGSGSTTLECSADPGGCCLWSSATPLSLVCKLEDETHELDIVMECDTAGGCEGYSMRLSWPTGGGGNSTYCLGEEWPQSKGVVGECTCDPLSVRFGPFRLWKDTPPPPMNYGDHCNCCTEFYIDLSL